jgi:hypothetical protein
LIKIYINNSQKSFLIKANEELDDLVDYYFSPYDNLGEEYVFESIFPEHLYRKNKNKCFEIATELREWIRDSSEHTLTPIYEYALLNILYTINEINEDLDTTLSVNLANDLERDDRVNGGYNLSDLKDIYFYIENCFEDHDFVGVGEVFEAFIKDPLISERINIDLDYYKDLVPWDIVEKYEKVKESFFVLISMLKDKVTLIKKNGSKFEDIKSSVQRDKIFIGDSTLEIVEGDTITRLLSNGLIESYIVTRSMFYEKQHGIPAHYQLSVRKETELEPVPTGGVTYINNVSGNGRLNIQSTDNSINFIGANNELFNKIKDVLVNSDISSEERAEIISHVDEMEASVGKPSFLTRYQAFITATANHMTVISPFIPELTKLLTNG